jgi:hypothetical protein
VESDAKTCPFLKLAARLNERHLAHSLDLVIIMDTIRIVLSGGLDAERSDLVPEYHAVATENIVPADTADAAPKSAKLKQSPTAS